MRWLALAVLGACSFKPAGVAGDGSQDSSPIDSGSGSGSDSNTVTIDAMVDAARPPAHVRSLEIVDAQVAGGPHTDFPMLVSLSGTWLESASHGGDVKRDDGFDIYFTEDFTGANRLAFEVDTYDEVAGKLLAWVKVPSLTAQTVIYVQYGDASITTDQSNRAQVWSNGYELVLHMDGTGDATGKNASTSSATATTGQIGGARDFDGATTNADLGSAPAIDNIFAGGGTFEAWVRPRTTGENGTGRVFDKASVGIFVDNPSSAPRLSYYHGCDGGGDCPAQWHFGANTVSFNTWHGIAVTHDTSAIDNAPSAVIDGVALAATEDYMAEGQFDSDSGSTGYLGNSFSGARAFDGRIDEVRLSSVARSNDWLMTTYRNENAPTAFYVVSGPL